MKRLPHTLAVASWGIPSDARLDLRYAPDEAEWLSPTPSAIWDVLIRSLNEGGAELVASYPVEDPYGGERGAEVVSRFFGTPVTSDQLTFGAGVTALLHALSGLTGAGPILAPGLVHPDLEAWAIARGHPVRLVDEPAAGARLLDAISATRPSLVHFDRPGFTGALPTLAEVETIARRAASVNAAVVIDESPAPYFGPRQSAATLVHRLDNLVVLRGFTKAYSCGGLRCAFALASPGIAGRVRELVPPMQAGELALHASLRMLDAGDVFAGLRARIRAVKPAFIDRLTAAGLTVLPGHTDLPWVVVTDDAGAAEEFLTEHGIRGLPPVPVPMVPAPPTGVLHLTVPLSDERITLCQELLSTPSRDPQRA